MVLYGDEFLALCERVRTEGMYIRRVDIKGAGYSVMPGDILPQENAERGTRSAELKQERCAPAVAQLWFDILKAA